AGQICTSIERAYVEGPIYDEFMQRIVERAAQVKTGFDESADVGAITVEAQLKKIEEQVDDALRRGARALVGGERVRGPGRFFAPTILADVTQEMRIMREETFGPVLPIMKVANAEEAVRFANNSPFALGSSVWGRSSAAQRVAGQLRAGMVSINDTLMNGVVAALPFGGLKDSGYGRVYGDEALREMSWPRGITVDRAGIREFAYYPLSKFGTNRVRGVVQLLSGSGVRNKVLGFWRVIRGK
ncbi:MAG TPA: aldehyde dehydrogenase family protein, partial [Longimicrobiales bacterium]